MSFVDSDVIDRILSEIIGEAMEKLGVDPNSDPEGAKRELRERVLEQWHRFVRFGVDSRESLAGVKVTLRRRQTRLGGEIDVSVDTRGTPLERRKTPPS